MLPMQMQQQATASCVHGDGKTETTIAKDVFAFQYKDNGKLVYIGKYDVNAGVGDLYYYDGKEARKLDTGITAIFIY